MLQDRIHRTLFAPVGTIDRLVSWLLAGAIIANVVVIAALTLPDLEAAQIELLETLNHGFVALFVVEYLLRLWTCTRDHRYRDPVSGRLRYAVGFFPLVDLLAILPALVPLTGGVNLEALRTLRILRILSLLRLGRYSAALRLFGRVVVAKRGELAAVGIIVAIVLVFASSIMYYLEHEAQPEVFASIPASLWWGIITLTTVGYGDAAPVTDIGRVVGGLIALLGVGIAALPAGIMAAGLHEALLKRREVGDTEGADHGDEPAP